MSLEECKRLAEKTEKRKKEVRRAVGLIAPRVHATGAVHDERVLVVLKRPFVEGFLFPNWIVCVHAYGELSMERFYRRKPADNHFEELIQKYGLKEAEN